MEKEKSILELKIQEFVKSFLENSKNQEIQIISHFDTDGITSASIVMQTLKKLDIEFSIKILKSLSKKNIDDLDKNKTTLFLDLASSNLEYIKNSNFKKVYIIDHHEITQEVPIEIEIINPELWEKQKMSTSQLSYLFAKEINKENAHLSKLAILGMIGDQLEKNLDKLSKEIIDDSNIQIRRGLLIYPATRPLNRVLEFCSDPFIPGVTGDTKGALDMLRESGFSPENGKYKSLLELTEEEMKKLVTAIVLRDPEKKDKKLIGDLFLIKMFGKLEDAREISAKINACSKSGKSHIALGLCLENQNHKKMAESIHIKYKRELINGIKLAEEIEKIQGENFTIINAKEQIKDTMIGTIISILANSTNYKTGTILIGMSQDEKNNTIKISARTVGKKEINAREFLTKIMESFEGEVGGHEFAAGCLIPKEKEIEFIEKIKQTQTQIPQMPNSS